MSLEKQEKPSKRVLPCSSSENFRREVTSVLSMADRKLQRWVAVVNPVSQEQFDNYMEGIGLCGLRNRPIAIAVSGGADSMALTHLLHQWLG